MKKPKEKKPKTVWSVLQNETLVGSYQSFALAQREAEKTCEADEGADVKILEVVKAWELIWPEEPAPETFEIGLDVL